MADVRTRCTLPSFRACRRCGPDAGTWNDARPLFYTVEMVRFEVRQRFHAPARPEELHGAGLPVITQAEVQAQVALRQIAPSAPDFVCLCQGPGDNLYPRIQRQFVALGPGEFETDPM